jgi:hypothetical protein
MQQDKKQVSAYLVGLQGLFEFWQKNGHLPAQRLFIETWKTVLNNHATFGSPFVKNRFNVPWTNFVFTDVARNFKSVRPEFFPELRSKFPSGEHGPFKSSIFVTLHSQLEHSIVSALQKLGGKCTMVANSGDGASSTIYDHTSGMSWISRDQNCLLVARKDLLEGRNLIVPVDYSWHDEKTATLFRNVGIGTFEFARKCGFKLFYFLPVIGDEGEINLFIEESDPKKGPADCADGFLEFCISHSPKNWLSDPHGDDSSLFWPGLPPMKSNRAKIWNSRLLREK